LMAPVPIVLRSMAHFPLAHSQPKMHRRRVCHSNFPQKRSRRRAAGLCLVVMPQPLQCGVSEEMRPARSPRLPHHLRGAPSCCSARRCRSLSCVSKRAQKHGRSDQKLAPNLHEFSGFFPPTLTSANFPPVQISVVVAAFFARVLLPTGPRFPASQDSFRGAELLESGA
jgi:hypothetical protein